MTYKTYVDPKAFKSAEKIGLRVTTLGETYGKISTGIFIGALNIITVLFGLYAVKNVNVPIFLCFRRCAIIFTIIVTYIMERVLPGKPKGLCALLMCGGAVVAGWEGFDNDSFGYFLVICNNFSQSIYSVFTSKYNADKRITPFEVNFFFAALGLPMCIAIVTYQGDASYLYDLVFDEKTFDINEVIAVVVSGCGGILITIASLLTVTTCGPSALNISGTLKDVLLTYLGFILFNDV